MISIVGEACHDVEGGVGGGAPCLTLSAAGLLGGRGSQPINLCSSTAWENSQSAYSTEVTHCGLGTLRPGLLGGLTGGTSLPRVCISAGGLEGCPGRTAQERGGCFAELLHWTAGAVVAHAGLLPKLGLRHPDLDRCACQSAALQSSSRLLRVLV